MITKVKSPNFKQKVFLLVFLMNLIQINAQNKTSKESTTKEPDINDIPLEYKYVDPNDTKNNLSFLKLSEKVKMKYDSIVMWTDFEVFKSDVVAFYEKNYISKVACDKKNLDAEKKKYGLSPVDSVLANLKFSNVSQLGFTLKPLGKEVEKIIKGITHIYGDNMDENWAQACENHVPAYCTHRDDGEQRYGVLLNPAAIQILNETLLRNNSNWRIPTKQDMDILNQGEWVV